MLLLSHGLDGIRDNLSRAETLPEPLRSQAVVIREFCKELLGVPADLHPAIRGMLHFDFYRKTLLPDPNWSYSKREWTPAEALHVLEINHHERWTDDAFFSRENVKLLARQYEGKTWVPDWSPLLFDPHSTILEGRHRLSAALLYNKPVIFCHYQRLQ